MKFRPLHDRVLVKRVEEEQKTKGGIIIPDTAKEKPMQGEVIAVGPGRYEKGERIPVDVKVGDKVIYGKYSGTPFTVEGDEVIIIKAGDRVLFGKWSGTEVKLDGEELIIMKESDIMGILEEGVAFKAAA